MRKIVFILLMLTIITSCNQGEGIELVNRNESTQPINIANINIGIEDDYLVIENIPDIILLVDYLDSIGTKKSIEWAESIGFCSVTKYFEDINLKLSCLSNIEELNKSLSELAKEGYYNEMDNSLCYPFIMHRLATVLNKNGVIKIEGQLYRYLNDEVIVSKNNSLQDLLLASSHRNYEDLGLCSFCLNKNAPIRKSATISGEGKVLTSYDLVEYSSDEQYRTRTNLYYEMFSSYNYNAWYVYENRLYVKTEKHKKTLGIWLRYDDNYSYAIYDIETGGNAADNRGEVHKTISVHESNPAVKTSSSDSWNHSFRIFSYNVYAWESEFLYPEIDEICVKWFTSKVPQSQWIVL